MEEQLKNDFEKSFKNSNFSSKNISLKKEFLNKFIKDGLPNKSLENWKFSDINQIIKKEIGDLSFYNDISTPNKIDPAIYLNGLEQNSIVFINGRAEKIDFQFEEKNKVEIFDDFELNNSYSEINSLINLNISLHDEKSLSPCSACTCACCSALWTSTRCNRPVSPLHSDQNRSMRHDSRTHRAAQGNYLPTRTQRLSS